MGRPERLAALADVDADDLVVADLGCGTGSDRAGVWPCWPVSMCR